MKNSNDLARKFAKLYSIEIIEAPNSHQYIKENNDVILFDDPVFWDAFGIAFSDKLFSNDENSTTLLEETTGFIAKHVDRVCFKTNEQFSNDIINSGNYQYAMAA
jgi:hypothetical protein